MDDFWDKLGVDSLEQLLDITKQRNVVLTLFPTGAALDSHRAMGRQAVWQRAVDEGHEIGNHTYSHRLLSKLSKSAIYDELSRQRDAVNRTLGYEYEMRLARPPGGDGGFSPRTAVVTAINDAGYSVAMWDIGGDNASPGEDFANALLDPKRKPLHNGAIVLTHPVTLPPQYFPQIIDGFREIGFEPTSITNLFKPG
jgi:peptidoglycan/xylan/chitin deacetylase (PgdA/CDA1 family)